MTPIPIFDLDLSNIDYYCIRSYIYGYLIIMLNIIMLHKRSGLHSPVSQSVRVCPSFSSFSSYICAVHIIWWPEASVSVLV